MQPLLGQRVKALRQERNLSMAEVSAGTGISKSFLSRIESGRSDITLGRLVDLLSFFRISFTELVPDPVATTAIVSRKGEERHIASRDEGIDMVLLRPAGNGSMQPFVVTYEPGAGTAERASHPGEEFLYVLDGEITLTVAGEQHVLSAGDNAYYAAELPHTTHNTGRGTATAFVVVTPAML